jgi:SAM-dependent methyltransferase
MPTIEENRIGWGRKYHWPERGDEWSALWGGVETHWHASLLPRIRLFLTGRMLEIAPGYGRWTPYLLDHADDYIGIDVAAECVEACRERFKGDEKARFEQNDGRSLDAVADRSIDFAFSFDSLVHVELDTLQAYLAELARKLSPNGVAFLHHSNLGAFPAATMLRTRLLQTGARRSQRLQALLRKMRLIGWQHWRGRSVTATSVAEAARAAGLVCIGQEIIDWGGESRKMIDTLSLFTLPGSRWERPNRVVRNPDFVAEARSASAIAKVYTSLGHAREG